MDRTKEDRQAQAADGYCFEDLSALEELEPMTADEWNDLQGLINA